MRHYHVQDITRTLPDMHWVGGDGVRDDGGDGYHD